MGNQWSTADIPDLSGKRIIVTGGNRGLGHASALELAKKGASVVITSRSMVKGEAAIAEIRKAVPDADVSAMELDLSSFASVRSFAAAYKEKYGNDVHVLLNNAGVANDDDRVTTDDGHELLWQTNVWSAVLLTQLLLPSLAEGATEEKPARVVFLSSVTSTMAKVKMNADDPESEGLGKKLWAYPHTKCADWMIVNALTKRFKESSSKGKVQALCAHPGFSSTDMTSGLGGLANIVMGMPASKGCLPQVRACVDPDAKGGEFYGPNTPHYSLQHLFKYMGAKLNKEPEMYGAPVHSKLESPYASDAELCEKLLCKAEEVVGAKFDIA